MNQQPSDKLFKSGLKIVRLLSQQKHLAFFVGGVVRNMILKRNSDNIDIATDATPDEVEKILKRAKLPSKAVGKKFGTILTVIDGITTEITTFRAEGRYSDNRHPDQVQFIKNYLDDAKRRDFTINALYFDPITKQIFDPTNGQKDLKAKLIRFVGDPRKRIDEDALRMLRGVRLATQLGFKLEKNTFAAIKTRAKYIQGISSERIKGELDKILLSKNRGEGLRLLQHVGLLKFIIPEFEILQHVIHHSSKYHLEGAVSIHLIRAAELVKIYNLSIIYAALFHDIGKVINPQKIQEGKTWKYSFKGHVKLSGELFEKFAKKYKFPREQKNEILFLISEHDNRKWFLNSNPETQIKFMLAQTNPEFLVEIWRVDSAANLRYEDGQKVWGTSAVLPIANQIINKIKNAKKYFHLAGGSLIMKYSNFKPGKELGRKVEEIKIQIVLGKIRSEDDLRKYLS